MEPNPLIALPSVTMSVSYGPPPSEYGSRPDTPTEAAHREAFEAWWNQQSIWEDDLQ